MLRLLAAVFWVLLLAASVACQKSKATDVWDVPLPLRMYDSASNRYFFRPGKGLDSVGADQSIMHLRGLGLVEVQIYGQDVELSKGDTFRIAIIHPIRQVYEDSSGRSLPDFLLLSPAGQDSLPLSFKEEGIGPISRQTYFSIDRQYYHLSSVDSSRQRIRVQALAPDKSRPKLAATLNLRFKPIPVKTLEQAVSTIRRPPNQALLVYFWGLGHSQGKDLLDLDSLYRSLPSNFPLAIAAINRGDSPERIAEFQQTHQIGLPLYLALPASCEGMNCSALLPHASLIDTNGRIVRNDLNTESLFDRAPAWLQLVQATSTN